MKPPSAPFRCLILTMICFIAGAAEITNDPIELRELPFDTVLMNDGRKVEGELLEKRTDGILRFKPTTGNPTVFPPTAYKSIEFRRSAAQVVISATTQALATNDSRRLSEILRWGIEHNAKDAVMAQAAAILKVKPAERDVLTLIAPLWREKQDWLTMEAAGRAGIVADQHWEAGNDLILEALIGQGRRQDADVFAKQWLARNPTALGANLVSGASFEQTGDLRAARECYRKAWDIGRSQLGAMKYASMALQTGQFAESLRAAQALIKDGTNLNEAKALGGAAAAALGDVTTAKDLLTDFTTDGVSAAAAQAGTYALGLIAFQEQRLGDAVRHWSGVQTPAAQFALAIAQRKEFTSLDRLPGDLRADAVLLNAAVNLERRQVSKAKELIDQHLDGRHAFLYRVMQVLLSRGQPETVRALAAVKSAESQQWQLYGHVIANRFAEADTLARSMPASDGYAMAARVFLAAARGDPEGARALFESSNGLSGAPPDYVRRLAELYNTADDQLIVEPFDWPAGEVLASGWTAISNGTGIRVYADSGKLIMNGIQTSSPDPLTRVTTAVPGARFRSARLAVDISGATQATIGLELLDGSKKNGVALAVVNGSTKLNWRQQTNGRWSDWRELAYAAESPIAILALDASGGRIFAADPADPLHRTQLSEVLARSQGDWHLSLFGSAEVGVNWKTEFDELRWRLRPEKK